MRLLSIILLSLLLSGCVDSNRQKDIEAYRAKLEEFVVDCALQVRGRVVYDQYIQGYICIDPKTQELYLYDLDTKGRHFHK